MKTGSFIDERDGKTYKTVKIGSQIWMAENLNFATPEGSWFYNNDSKNGEKYGRLYNWHTAMKVAPAGWHLPSEEEWLNMIRLVGGGINPLYELNTVDFDETIKTFDQLIEGGASGFNALFGGERQGEDQKYGAFFSIGDCARFWTSEDEDLSLPEEYLPTGEDSSAGAISIENGSVYSYWIYKTDGHSVRCVNNSLMFDTE